MIRWNTDLRQQANARRAFKLPVAHDVTFAKTAGVCETLEGPVPYKKDDAIMTGLVGENWPVPHDYFLATYEAIPPTEAGCDGKYLKRKIMVWVMMLESDTSVSISDDKVVLSGSAGDWLVQYEPGSFGIVEKDVFRRTYELVG